MKTKIKEKLHNNFQIELLDGIVTGSKRKIGKK